MSFKALLRKFTFHLHDDFDDQKTEKELKILRRELAVDQFMFESAVYDHEVETILMHMKRPLSVCQHALRWFESELKSNREKIWKVLKTEKNIDLSNAMPYLIKINKTDAVWQTLDNRGKDYIYEWQRRANFTILEMFILRHKALSVSQKLKTLFKKKKH